MKTLDWFLIRQVAPRFFLSIVSITVALIGMFVPESYHFQTLHYSGPFGHLSNLIILTLALVAFFDVLVNEMLDARFSMHFGSALRHIVWGWLAVTYVAYALVSAKADTHGLLTLFFVVLGSFCASIALLDTAYDIRRRTAACSATGSTRSTQSPSQCGRLPHSPQG